MATGTFDDAGVVTIEGLTISAPGVRGDVSVERGPIRRAVRRGGPAPRADALEQALRRHSMRTTRTVTFAGHRAVRRGGPAPVTVTVKAPRKGREQVVLTIEGGVATWHLSRESRSRSATALAAPTRTYVIPQVAQDERRATRGLGFSISSIIKVITFPVAQIVGKVARFAARKWDTDHHPSLVRAYGPDGGLTDLAEADWKKLATGPVLLFVHGTFSTTAGAFVGLPAATRKELHKRYGGRVIAFDHPTIADDPFVNARSFFDIVGDRKLDVDIVCHSRGGLVSRSIAERPGSLSSAGPNVSVRQVVLVGALSNGTILADAENWGELLDRFTTMLHLLPVAPGVVETLETVLAVIKSIAIQTADDLEGLSAMKPGSPFLARLNTGGPGPGDARYRAITSNFEPKDPDLKAWLNDEIRDGIFDAKPNDMMVRIDSMTGPNGSGRFPIAPADCRGFDAADSVEHAQYFSQPLTSSAFMEWLTA